MQRLIAVFFPTISFSVYALSRRAFLLGSMKYGKVRSETGKQEAHCAPEREQPVSICTASPHTLPRMPHGSRILLFKYVHSTSMEAFSHYTNGKFFSILSITDMWPLHYLSNDNASAFRFLRHSLKMNETANHHPYIFDSFLWRDQLPY